LIIVISLFFLQIPKNIRFIDYVILIKKILI
jgi:hypothetical protein